MDVMRQHFVPQPFQLNFYSTESTWGQSYLVSIVWSLVMPISSPAITYTNNYVSLTYCIQVNSLIVSNFSVTQRIPTNQPLACHCFSSSDVPVRFSSRVLSYSHRCIDGYTIELNSLLWAGLIPTPTSGSALSLYPPDIPCPAVPPNATAEISEFTSFVHESRRRAERAQGNFSSFDPLDVVPYADGLIPGGGAPVICFNGTNVSMLVDFERQGEFSIEVCSRGYCRGDLRDSWFVANVDFPCVKNRQGPLCGQCKPGYAVTLYSTVSQLHTCSCIL